MHNDISDARVTSRRAADVPNNASVKKTDRGSRVRILFPAIAIALLATGVAQAAHTRMVRLGAAEKFVILSETGITDVYKSQVEGNVGTSPITGEADHLTCGEVVGRVYSVDAAGPAPCNRAKPAKLGKAIGAMKTAYTDAAGRTPTVTELGAGNIGGLTLPPGVYSWSSNVLIPSNVTLLGGPKDVWIFQVAQNVNLAPATSIMLSGGALPQHIFWQVAGTVNMGTTSSFQGIVLSMTAISMETGASINGRLYAQTAVSLQMNSVLQPVPPIVGSSTLTKFDADLAP
jgi:hypothetical protein